MKKTLKIDDIKKILSPLLRNNGVDKADIFGSYARGEQTDDSDVDLLVRINKDFGLIEIIKLKRALEETINKKIDLVECDTIRPELKEKILGDEIPILLWIDVPI